jgi:hypothetical protein
MQQKYAKYIKKNNNQTGGIVENNNIYNLTMNEILDNTFLVHVFNENGFFNSEIVNENGKIIWRYKITDDKKNLTGSNKMIHTSWGTEVLPHRNGQWDAPNDKFAIITPLKLQKNAIYKINPNDTMIFDELVLNYESQFICPDDKINIVNKKYENCLLFPNPFELTINSYDNTKKTDDEINYLLKEYETKLNPDDYEILKYFTKNLTEDYIRFTGFGIESHIIRLEKEGKTLEEIKDELKAMGKMYYTLKQINELLPLAVSISYVQTLREIINMVIPENSFVNRHCKINENITYNHPTICFDYNGKNYNLYDVVEKDLREEEGKKLQLYGRHFGTFSYRGEDTIDIIQEYRQSEENSVGGLNYMIDLRKKNIIELEKAIGEYEKENVEYSSYVEYYNRKIDEKTQKKEKNDNDLALYYKWKEDNSEYFKFYPDCQELIEANETIETLKKENEALENIEEEKKAIELCANAIKSRNVAIEKYANEILELKNEIRKFLLEKKKLQDDLKNREIIQKKYSNDNQRTFNTKMENMNKKFMLLLGRKDNQFPISQDRKNNITKEFTDMMSHFNRVKF